MQKIIGGKRYDTERARRVSSDEGKALYRKKTGEFFLYSEAEGFELLSYEEARSWAELHDGKAYDELFGAIEDGITIMTSYSLPADLVEQVRRKASETGKTQSTIVAEAIKKILIGESGGSEQ